MDKNIRRFILVPVLMALTAGFFCAASAHAQSITIINQTSCIQWLQVYNSSMQLTMTAALTPNAQKIAGSAKGTGIGRIKGGPTKAVNDCCYRKVIDASPNLSGNTWRIEIHSDSLKVIDGDKNWTEVFNQSGNFSNCNFSVAAPSLGVGSSGSGEQPRN